MFDLLLFQKRLFNGVYIGMSKVKEDLSCVILYVLYM